MTFMIGAKNDKYSQWLPSIPDSSATDEIWQAQILDENAEAMVCRKNDGSVHSLRDGARLMAFYVFVNGEIEIIASDRKDAEAFVEGYRIDGNNEKVEIVEIKDETKI